MPAVGVPSDAAVRAAAAVLETAGFTDVANRLLGGRAPSVSAPRAIPANAVRSEVAPTPTARLWQKVLVEELIGAQRIPTALGAPRGRDPEYDDHFLALLQRLPPAPGSRSGVPMDYTSPHAVEWAPSLCWRLDVGDGPVPLTPAQPELFRNGLVMPGWVRVRYAAMPASEQPVLYRFLQDCRGVLADRSTAWTSIGVDNLEGAVRVVTRIMLTFAPSGADAGAALRPLCTVIAASMVLPWVVAVTNDDSVAMQERVAEVGALMF